MPIVLGLIFFFILGILVSATGSNSPILGLVAIGIMVGGFLLWMAFVNLKKKSDKDAEEKRRKDIEEKRRKDDEEYWRNKHEREQLLANEIKQKQLAQMISNCNQLVKSSMPKQIADAECFLDNAESEFADGAFAPFWEEIEKATNELAGYYQNLQNLSLAANECIEHAAIPDLKMRNTILSIKPAINFIAYRFPLPPKKWLFGKINRDIKMKYN